MEKFASADLTVGQINAIVKKLGGHEGSLKFLRGELEVSIPSRHWTEKNGAIRFSVTSDGTTGPEWIDRLEKGGFRIGDYAKSVLRSSDFKPTAGVTTEVAVLKGELFSDENRTTAQIRVEATKRGWATPNAEIACLIREKFTDEDIKVMGLWWIVAMHDPIKDSDGDPTLLDAGRNVDGRWLIAYCGLPGGRWGRGSGFAFAVPQV